MNDRVPSLEAWSEATGLVLPWPAEGPVASLLEALGPRAALHTAGERGGDLCDRAVLAALLEAMGRPVRAFEHEALLWATPVPVAQVERALRDLLHHGAFWVRQAAVRLLAERAVDPTEALIEALDDPDDDVRRTAAGALGGRTGRGAREALALRPWDAHLAVDAARVAALAPHGAWVAEVAERLPVGRGGDWLRAGLAAASGDRGAALPLLAHEAPEVRGAIGAWLAHHPGAAAEAVEHLAASVREAPGVEGAVAALAAAGAEGREVALAWLDDPDPGVRQAACAVLAQQGVACDALRARLDDEVVEVQRDAALALLAAGGATDAVREGLVRAPTRSGGFLARAYALGVSLGPLDVLWHGRPATPDLLSLALAPGDERVRSVACLWLGVHAPDAAGAVLSALADDAARRVPLAVRRAAAAATMWVGVPSDPIGVRLLVAHGPAGAPTHGLGGQGGALARAAMTDPDGEVRAAAVTALVGLGAEAVPFAPLVAWLAARDPVAAVRAAAEGAVPPRWADEGLGASVATVVTPMPGASDGVRRRALRRVWSASPEWGRAVARALPLGDAARDLAREAARLQGAALEGREAEAAARRALAALDDPRWAVREAAADLLGALPPATLDPALREEVVETLAARARSDYDGDVQAAAAMAAARLGGGVT